MKSRENGRLPLPPDCFHDGPVLLALGQGQENLLSNLGAALAAPMVGGKGIKNEQNRNLRLFQTDHGKVATKGIETSGAEIEKEKKEV